MVYAVVFKAYLRISEDIHGRNLNFESRVRSMILIYTVTLIMNESTSCTILTAVTFIYDFFL